jgi:uncharacterized repeat protein (TIGR01451 family)
MEILTMKSNSTLSAHKLRTGLLPIFLVLVVVTAANAQGLPTFSKSFDPSTIAPGSVSTLTFTITNSAPTPVTDLAFTDVLPTVPGDVDIATPANASTTCDIAFGGSGVTAPDGGGTITFSDGELGGGESCTVTVDVTASTPGTHTNPAITLSSSAGSSMSLAVDLTVSTTLPGFSKSFAPSSVPLGGRSTLTFTIDNQLNPSRVGNLDFTDNLPVGMLVADPANASTDCISASAPDTTITAAPGTSVITLDANGSNLFAGFEVLPIGATCTVTVDVTGTGTGMLDNVSDELLADFVSSGKASATLDVTITDIALTKSFTDDPVIPGGSVTLEFTIDNVDRNFSASGIAFTDDLTTLVPALAGLTFDSLLSNDCGGSVSGVGGTTIGFTGGTLGPEGSCTIRVSLSVPAGATPGIYTNTTGTITATIDGSPEVGNMAADDLFVEPVPVLTKEFLEVGTLLPDPVINAGDDVVIRFTITNTSTTSDATDIAFVDELTDGGPLTGFLPFPVTVTLPPVPTPPCGIGSSLALAFIDTDREGLSLIAGSLTAAPGAGSSCTFDVTVTIPATLASGIYVNTTEEITATVDGATRTGDPASDSLTVIAAPQLTKEFTDDPVAPGGTVTLEFTLTHPPDASTAATGITFTDNLAPVLAGLTANLPPSPDPPCGVGSSLTGSAGDTLLTFMSGTLSPGESCAFSVTLDVPMGAAPGTYANTTSGVSAMVEGLAAASAPASDDLKVSGLTFTKEFIGDPVIAGDTVTLRFTIENIHPTDDATITSFTDNLAADLPGLAATGPPSVNTCGGSLSGTNFLTYTGGSLMSGLTCTIEVDLLVPAGAADDTYNNITSSVTATLGGSGVTLDPATDELTVNSNLLQLTKAFTDDPVSPGDTVNLRFTLTNLDTTQAASAIAFTDDLGAVLAGLVATGLPFAACGGTVDAIPNAGTIDFSGGSLGPGAQCQFDVSVTVPGGASVAIFPNTTSGVTGTIGGFSVSGDAASDDLNIIDLLEFSKSFDGPTTATGTPVLTFTITNQTSNAVTDLSFSDDLDAVITGLIATNLPLSDVCGSGSLLSGTSFLTLTGGNLPPTGGTCSFDVELLVPGPAIAGTFPNTTSDLLQGGLLVAEPATADLTVEPPPTFAKGFAPTAILQGGTSTLTFTIDNTASALAASSLDVTDNLPVEVAIADSPNASVTCTGGTLTAVAGASTITYTGGSVAAAAICTVQVDVTSTTFGAHVNTTGDLTSSSGNSGTASDTFTVEPPPTFSKGFAPSAIGAGSTSTLTFTIDNTASMLAANSLAFIDDLSSGVVIDFPANAVSTCTGGTLSAPDGGLTISYSGGQVAANSTCTISVNVTSSTVGMHTNTSGDLTSDAGNSGPATGTLTVNAALPGFIKSFAPSLITPGSTSLLTLTVDNTANAAPVANLDFTDNLPTGMVIATPANASTDCSSGTLTAVAGTSTITYTGGSVVAGTSCTVQVDVTSSTLGTHVNTTGNLTSDAGTSGFVSAVITVIDSISLSKSFTDDPVVPGGTVTLAFTITNFDRTNAAANIAFSDNLGAVLSGLAPTGPLPTSPCGVGSLGFASGILTLTGGSLAPQGSCTFSVTLQVPAAAAAGTFTNTTSAITADLNGSSVTGAAATDDLVIENAPLLTKTFTDDPVPAGDTVTLEFSITNTDTTASATDIAFTDDLAAMLPGLGVTLPADGFCGAGSTMTLIAPPDPPDSPQTLSMTGGNLAAGASCTFDVTLDVPATAPAGTFTNTTSTITATVDGMGLTGKAASDDLVVVAAPILTKSFTDDPVFPGDPVTLEFTLTHDPNTPADATGITFSDDLAATLSGLMATGLPLTDLCGAGNGTLTGSIGDTLLTFQNATLVPGETCTFSVTLQVPDTAPAGNHTNTTSNVTATSLGLAATGNPATDVLEVAGLALSKSFTDDPVVPGDTVTLEFILNNTSPVLSATDIAFTDDLDLALSGLVATGLPATDVCGTGSQIDGTDLLTFTGGSLAPGTSCTFIVTLQVPAGATVGEHNNTTSQVTADVDGTAVTVNPAQDKLFVADPLLIVKSFTDDPAIPGGTVSLEFTIANADPVQNATGIMFTDDLDAALSGLVAVGLPATDVCGTGSQIDGTDLLTFTGGSLAPGTSCTFSVTLQVPTGVPPGTIATNTTSAVMGDIGGGMVTGNTATDDLQIELLVFSKAFAGDTGPGATTALTFTIQNPDPTSSASDITFTDDLEAVISGLVATGLPANDVCGSGSQLTGTSLLTLSGGNLSPGETCMFNVTLQVPDTAPFGTFTNSTDTLRATMNGTSVTSSPAIAMVTVNEPPTFSKGFAPNSIVQGDTSTLTFTIDNTANLSAAASNLDVTDNLPAAVVIATPANASTTCTGGTLTAAVGSSVITYRGGTAAAGVSCTVQVDVTSSTAGAYLNTTGDLTSSLGNSGTASATLDVNNPGIGITKAPASQIVVSGGTAMFTITVTNSGDADLTNVAVSDPLAPDCDMVIGALASGAMTSYTCMLAGVSADLTNVATVTGDAPVGPPVTASDSATVTISPAPVAAPGFSKSFAPNPIDQDGTSTLTFIIDNTTSTNDATSLNVTDNLPAEVMIADPPNASTDCTGGTLTVEAGESIITYSGGTVLAGETCTLTVDVTSSTVGLHVNTTGDLTSSLGVSDPASATLTVNPPPVFRKSFVPDPIVVGGTSTLTFTIDNAASTAAATRLAFSDSLPAGVLIATPANAATTCTGGTLDAPAGTPDLTYSGGTVAAGASCTLTVDVTGTTVGQAVNTTGDLTSSLGVSGTASDTLIVVAPDLQLMFVDGSDTVEPGEVLTYIVEFANLGTQVATGVILTEIVPDHTSFNAGASTPGWSCGDGSAAGTVCTLALGALKVGTSGTATFAVTVDATLPTDLVELVHSASLSDDGLNGVDLNLDDNVEERIVVVAGQLALTSPRDGDTVAGGLVAVASFETPLDTVTVLFQFRPLNSTVWVDIGTATVPPFFTATWNTLAVADGVVDLRAQAHQANGTTHTTPVIQVTVANSGMAADITVLEDEFGRTQMVSADEDSVVVTSEGVIVEIPAGALDSDDTITLDVVQPQEASGTPPGDPAALLVDISLASGQDMFTEPLTIRLAYLDADQDGLVDGTSIDETTLTLWFFDVNTGSWVIVIGSVVRPDANVVEGTVNHLTEFGLFAAPLPGTTLQVTLGAESPVPEAQVFVAATTRTVPVLQLQLDAEAETCRLTNAILVFTTPSGTADVAEQLQVDILNDTNGNGVADPDEAVLATAEVSDVRDVLTLTLDSPRALVPGVTTHLLVTLTGPRAATTPMQLAVLPLPRGLQSLLGWGVGAASVLGLFLAWRRRRGLSALLILLILGWGLVLSSCYGDGPDTVTFNVTLPANGLQCVGDTTGLFTVPAAPLVGATVIATR